MVTVSTIPAFTVSVAPGATTILRTDLLEFNITVPLEITTSVLALGTV